MMLNPPVKSMAAVLCAHPVQRYLIQRLLFLTKFLNLAFLDQITGHAHNIVILQVSGEITQSFCQ